MGTLICMNIFILFAHFSICLAVLHKAPAKQLSRSPQCCISWGQVWSTGSQICSKMPTRGNVQLCSWLPEQQSCPRALGNTSPAFRTGKIGVGYNIFGVTTSCKSLSRSVEGSVQTLRILSRASLLSVLPWLLAFILPCPLKGHCWHKAAESSPEGSCLKCLLRGAVTESLQVFAQFSFFFSLSCIPSIAAQIKASRWVAFPQKPTQPVWFPSWIHLRDLRGDLQTMRGKSVSLLVPL